MASDLSFFFFNDTATTEIYTLSLHDALPIDCSLAQWSVISLLFPIRPSGQYTESVLLPTLTENFVGCCTGRSAGLSPPRSGSQCRARLEFCAGSGRKKGRGLRDRGVPLPCVTSVSTTSNLGLPRS